MKKTVRPGWFHPGLFILTLIITAIITGCAVQRQHSAAPPPPHTTPRNEEQVQAEQPEETPKEPQKASAPVEVVTDTPKTDETPKNEPQQPSEADEESAQIPETSRGEASERPEINRTNMLSEFAHGNPGVKAVALTFDAGASPKPTPQILRTLEQNGLHATFFLTGKWMEANPALARQVAAEGDEIGNHSYSHPDFRKLSDEEIRDQLSETENIAKSIAGVSTKPYFRPPFGGRDKRVKQVAADEGYRTIYWSVDSWDAFKKGITTQEIRERVLSKVKNGSVVLMHCGSQATADALPEIISELKARGYTITTISELIRQGE